MLTTIELHYDVQTQSLVLLNQNQCRVELAGPAHRVQWLIRGCPNDCFPRVDFLVDDTQPRGLGPFVTLRQNPSYVISGGLIPEAGTFPYGVRLYRSNDNPAAPIEPASEELRDLVLEKAESGTGGLNVRVWPDGNGGLEVEPEYLSICTGDTVQWTFEGFTNLPAWIPRVTFFRSPALARQQTSRFGPFASMTTEETRVVGSGRSGVLGRFAYLAEVIDATTGEILFSKLKDPGLAEDGDPPGGMGG